LAPANSSPAAPLASLEQEVIALVNSMGIEFTVNPTFEEVVTRIKNYLASHPRSAPTYKKITKDFIQYCRAKNRPIVNSDTVEGWMNERHELWVQYQAAVKASMESNGAIPMPERPPQAYCCNTLWSYTSMITKVLGIGFRVDLPKENPGTILQ
jgi:hypothetical protein